MADDHAPPNISTTGGGALLTASPVGREVKYYPVIDSELDMVSLTNSLSTLCLSLGTGFLGYAINLLHELLSTKAPGNNMVELTVTLAVVAALFYVIGGWLWLKRGSLVRKIQEKARTASIGS